MQQVAQERNSQLLKEHPELGPALNDMAKRFAELSSETNVFSEGKGTTKAFKGTQGLMDSIANRVKLLDAVERALIQLPKIGPRFREALNKIISNQEVTSREVNDVMSFLDTAFNLDPKGKTLDIHPLGVENLYKTFRSALTDKQRTKLDNSRDYLQKWYGTSKGLNEKDLNGFSPEDIESRSFR